MSATATPIAPKAAPASLLAAMLMPGALGLGALQAAGTESSVFLAEGDLH